MDNGILGAVADDDEEAALLLLKAIADEGGDPRVSAMGKISESEHGSVPNACAWLTLSFGSSWSRMWADLQTADWALSTAMEGPKNCCNRVPKALDYFYSAGR
jgi:hypothetical protein